MQMKRQQITTAVATRSPAELWAILLAQARTLEPFWIGAVTVFASRTSLPDAKRDSYLQVIRSAFDKMDDWRNGTAKYVKARRNEIDSAISFLRNKAIETPNRSFRFAPAARNAASALRSCLYISARGYDDKDLPALAAANLYDLAAVRTLFPFDFGNLMIFHPGKTTGTEEDPLDVTLPRASHKLGIGPSVDALIVEVERLWENLKSPPPLKFTADYWTAEGNDANVQLRSASIAAFHNKS